MTNKTENKTPINAVVKTNIFDFSDHDLSEESSLSFSINTNGKVSPISKSSLRELKKIVQPKHQRATTVFIGHGEFNGDLSQ